MKIWVIILVLYATVTPVAMAWSNEDWDICMMDYGCTAVMEDCTGAVWKPVNNNSLEKAEEYMAVKRAKMKCAPDAQKYGMPKVGCVAGRCAILEGEPEGEAKWWQIWK